MADVQQPKLGRPFCILNGHSVRVEEAKAQIARAASERGVEVEVVVTKRGDDIGAFAKRALADGRRLVVAGGGDGTVNAPSPECWRADAALGILPMGTLNHFAKDAGLPLGLEAAAQTLFQAASPRSTSARSTAACSLTTQASASTRTSCANGKRKSGADTRSVSPSCWLCGRL